jgi:hypothetical protein
MLPVHLLSRTVTFVYLLHLNLYRTITVLTRSHVLTWEPLPLQHMIWPWNCHANTHTENIHSTCVLYSTHATIHKQDVDATSWTVGYTAAGEWLQYTRQFTGGMYDIWLSAATPNAQGELGIELRTINTGAKAPGTGTQTTYSMM